VYYRLSCWRSFSAPISEIEAVKTMLSEAAAARNASEESLRESEARYRSLFEAANAGKSLTLPSGEI
jgi:PAS domain-containing protein